MATAATPAVPTTDAYINPAGFSTPGLENHGSAVWLALVIMVTISGLMVAARVSIRASSRQMGSDDWAILAALGSCLIQTSLWAMSVRTGYGSDYLKLSISQRQTFNKYWFLGAIWYPITLGLFKTSVILLNKRIFVQQKFQIACWVTLVVNSCWCLGNTLGWIFQCLPVQSMWGMAVGHCWDTEGEYISLVTWDVATDLWIMGMAVPMIWQLRLDSRQKMGLLGIFLLGTVVVIFSIMSCSAVMTSVQYENLHGHKKNKYGFALANLFQVLESNMGIIGACLPVLRIPAKQYLPRLFGGSKDSGRQSSPYYESGDSFTDRYVLQKVSSDRPKDSGWHNVSVSGGDLFRSSARRKSDELGIIEESAEMAGKSPSIPAWSNGSMSPFPHAIRKESKVEISVGHG
ncbi:hypothetical protein LTR62_002533 [Meristemomyces frigidus]|uniref:Rhodopsin domain-containing protein n=1 Tax=Meristemomyces frigidus TaxID=1508187 RepID=A0AAN7TLQ4_9PEZI|nr:hypothetical protein LTR62_002533 [Meristemomyces frigidus]